jgi:single-stranded DNA-binding protein
MSIDAALLGTVVRDAELRRPAACKPWMSVILWSRDGDAASFVQVAIFGDAAVALGRIEKNEKLYAEGSIRINEWTTAAGVKRSGLSMVAWCAERPGVGRNKPKRSKTEPARRPPMLVQ